MTLNSTCARDEVFMLVDVCTTQSRGSVFESSGVGISGSISDITSGAIFGEGK